MLEIFKSTDARVLEKVDVISKGCWVNMYAPTAEEINKVSNDAQVDVDIIKDALDDEERPRIERDDGRIYIIVDFPYTVQDESGLTVYETIPIGIILTDECIITVSLKDTPILEEFRKNRVKEFFTFKKTRFALQILFVISSYYLRYLKQINKKTNEIEREVHQSLKNKELYAFLALEKSLVYFTTSLRSNKVVLDKILRFNYLKMYEEDKELLEDVIIEITQAIEMAETYRSILSGMMNAFASIISNNLNIVMKFLTSITIILSFPTMVASFYGMNVDIPFQHATHSYAIPLVISASITSLTAFIFWKKKYF
ncbi:magnesium transporter CorA family protein [Neobacillus sp. MM2021_6]|uniref:magnesium transporter CorA family protein n=1 Tax=Bacillaceae TaxID=186817 RepID=UPI00140AFAAB|nr:MULTISPECIES: magnesium transporter CorA family protein [Bacillaceae]MBO0958879.1 magnesium transporter CorA family protein [Neobacillus sp. MM2021_6]NHC17608.1 magnesium transporter CorA family protein [Bacillus sp. MM2020_4]